MSQNISLFGKLFPCSPLFEFNPRQEKNPTYKSKVIYLKIFQIYIKYPTEATPSELPAKGKKGKKDETVKGKESAAKSGEDNFVVKFSTLLANYNIFKTFIFKQLWHILIMFWLID